MKNMSDNVGAEGNFFENLGGSAEGLFFMDQFKSGKSGGLNIDLVLAMCIPVILRFLGDAFEKIDSLRWVDLERRLKNWCRLLMCNHHHRFITYRSVRDNWGYITNMDPDSQNSILFKAIQLYLHQYVKLDLKSADIDLTSTRDKQSSIGNENDDGDNSDNEDSSKTLVGTLSEYKLLKRPIKDKWYQIGFFGHPPAPVELQIEDHTETSRNHDKNPQDYSVKTFHLVSPSGEAIDLFLNNAYKYYLEELRKLEDNSRYFYELKNVKKGKTSEESKYGPQEGNNNGPLYSRYKLSDEKTFESLFFRQKESLLSLVNHFQDRSGKYGIKGYPHKLGLLLHGPPGTGKTSLIKALAQQTGRSIVNVPLAKVTTNSELMSIFFDQTYYIQGADVPVRLDFKDVIFVMEDVDCASKVVQRRDGQKVAGNKTQPELEESSLLPKSMWQVLLTSNESECQELVKLLKKKSARFQAEAEQPEVLKAAAQRMMSIPGLGLVGKDPNDTIHQEISKEAVESADALLESYNTVDSFVRRHAKSLKSLIEAGAVVDDDFIDVMVGNTIPQKSKNSSNRLQSPSSKDIVFNGEGINNDMGGASIMAHTARCILASVAAGQHGIAGDIDGGINEEQNRIGFGLGDFIGPSKLANSGTDQLNLTGLLNVLDGIVDSPGRIVIMTTNHPEMLDPALIRPGRIDKKLMLGCMAAPDAVLMIEHYFQSKLNSNQLLRVEDALQALDITPAQMEQLSAEYEEVDEIIQALEEARIFH